MKKFYKILILIPVVLIGMFFFVSCNTNKKDNGFEEKQAYIFDYYKNDSLKLKAAKFLFSELKDNVHIENKTIIPDIKTINAKTLVRNIDLSFDAAGGLLKANIIDFDDFLNYVLPYRINYSKPEPWKDEIMRRKEAVSVRNSRTRKQLINSINVLNNKILTGFKFDLSNNREDTLSYSEILKTKKGSCVTMAYLAQYYYRALGVPVSYDFVICWGNTIGGHSWNSLILPDSNKLQFLGLEQKIMDYNPFIYYGGTKESPELGSFKKAGKVFRNTYTIQRNSLSYKYKGTGILPDMLRDYRTIDVTEKYTKTKDINTRDLFKDNSKLLLICNYNTSWVPVAAAENNNAGFVFKNMGLDMLYLFATYNNKKYGAVYSPVYLDTTGKLITLKPEHKKGNIKIEYLKSVISDQSYFCKGYNYEMAISVAKNLTRRQPLKSKSYTLYLWNNGWEKYRVEKCIKDKEVVFKDIPMNALYMVAENEINFDDRPFMMIGGQIKWL